MANEATQGQTAGDTPLVRFEGVSKRFGQVGT